MHKTFYASGFIYYPPTQQILLQQKQTSGESSSAWSLFSEISHVKETPEETFHRVIHTLLRIKLPIKTIYPVYTYFDNKLQKDQHITYAVINKFVEFQPHKGFAFGWFTRKQLLKLPISEQIKQDIIVGQRVVDAQLRKSLGERTLE